MIGAILIYAAWYSFRTASKSTNYRINIAPTSILLFAGAVLGFLSALTGLGGGIFLSALLLFFKWSETRVIPCVAAAFILVNSIAGFLGVISKAPILPTALPLWVAVIGGFIGAKYGSKRLGNPVIQKLLAIVLVITGLKMIATA